MTHARTHTTRASGETVAARDRGGDGDCGGGGRRDGGRKKNALALRARARPAFQYASDVATVTVRSTSSRVS